MVQWLLSRKDINGEFLMPGYVTFNIASHCGEEIEGSWGNIAISENKILALYLGVGVKHER